jgi:hypothetical protein
LLPPLGVEIHLGTWYSESKKKNARGCAGSILTRILTGSGTLQVQGKDKDIFVNDIFPVLKKVENSIPMTSISVKAPLNTPSTEEPTEFENSPVYEDSTSVKLPIRKDTPQQPDQLQTGSNKLD